MRLAICFLLVSLIAFSQTDIANQVVDFPGTLRAAIERARQAGKTIVDAPVIASEYPRVETLQDALKLTTPAAVHVVNKDTALSQDGDTVLTTYTVRIIDNISDISFAKANATPDSAILPSAVGAPPPNTFHVLVNGGTTVIDGITIAIPERPTPLSIGDDYLLFIRLEKNRDGAPIRLGTLPIGDAGVLKYDPATDTISPTGGKHNKDLVSKIMKTSGGLYSSLRGILVAGGALTSGVQR